MNHVLIILITAVSLTACATKPERCDGSNKKPINTARSGLKEHSVATVVLSQTTPGEKPVKESQQITVAPALGTVVVSPNALLISPSALLEQEKKRVTHAKSARIANGTTDKTIEYWRSTGQ